MAILEQVKFRFGNSNPRREALMIGLKSAIENFRQAGVKRIWIDGSFVTSKFEPNDIDGCWRYLGKLLVMNLIIITMLQQIRY
ncbi:hypothetical protein AXG55_10100 [Silvanigrella aquatica]|uniref:Uncharacterized protein n=1 Tax=Silvanigrella aquatica TaxID=1915309 RepID=A0A1L4D208_9BACT|nr:hypothetical protein AXG55_10100 [Silvanigrella aquatica]